MGTASAPAKTSQSQAFEIAVWDAVEDLTLPMRSLENKYIDSTARPKEIRAIYKEFLDNDILADEARIKLFALIA